MGGISEKDKAGGADERKVESDTKGEADDNKIEGSSDACDVGEASCEHDDE